MQPSDLSFELRRYSDATDVVIPSDADKLVEAVRKQQQLKHLKRKAEEGGEGASGETATAAAATEPAEGGEEEGASVAGKGPELALALTFTLPSSSYATVLLVKQAHC